MINLATEKVVPLARGNGHLPRRRRNKPVHPATMFRWAKYGVKADDGEVIVLETIRVGRTLCTYVEAIQRFCERLTGTPAPTTSRRTVTRQQREDERAAKECERLGL